MAYAPILLAGILSLCSADTPTVSEETVLSYDLANLTNREATALEGKRVRFQLRVQLEQVEKFYDGGRPMLCVILAHDRVVFISLPDDREPTTTINV